jgi:hypothetical protein
MFLRTSIFALFLTSFQPHAGDEVAYSVEHCTKNAFIKKTELELALCTVDCPQDVFNIVNQCIQENIHIIEIPTRHLSGGGPGIMIFKKTDRGPDCW